MSWTQCNNQKTRLGDLRTWDRLSSQVHKAAVESGLGNGGYKLLRIGTNVVLINDTDSLVARVALDDVPIADMASHLKLLILLKSSGAPLVCPLTDPVNLDDGRQVTFWPLVDASKPAEPEVVANLVARCHVLPPPPGIRRWTPYFYDAQVATRLQQSLRAGAPAAVVAELQAAWETASQDLASRWEKRPDDQADVVLHGDPNPSNTGRDGGQWLLFDCDSVCCGPPEIDLAQIISYTAAQGDPDRGWTALDAYRLPIDDELLQSAVRARMVKRCSWVAALWGTRPESQSVFLHMVATLDDPKVHWTAL